MAATRDSITDPNGTSRAEVMRALIGCGLTTENNPKNGFDFIFSSFFSLSLCYPVSYLLEKDQVPVSQFQPASITQAYSILSTPSILPLCASLRPRSHRPLCCSPLAAWPTQPAATPTSLQLP